MCVWWVGRQVVCLCVCVCVCKRLDMATDRVQGKPPTPCPPTPPSTGPSWIPVPTKLFQDGGRVV